MLGLKVTVNDEEPVVAGADDLAVVKAAVTLAGALGARTQHPRPGEASDRMVTLVGLTSKPQDADDEHLRWLSRFDLEVGDRVVIEIVETDRPHDPVSRKPAQNR